MKNKAAGTRRNYVSLLAAMLFVVSAMPTWAQDKVPTLRGPAAGAAGQSAVRISPLQAPDGLACNLWSLPQSSVNTTPYANQQFEETQFWFDVFLADDFINSRPWLIDTVFVPGALWGGATTLAEANSLHFEIYRDGGGKPNGDPRGGGKPPVWSLAVSPADSRITIETLEIDAVLGLYQSNVTLTLETPVRLNSGVYWLVFYPQLDFLTYGQYGRFTADSANRSPAQVMNPDEAVEYGYPIPPNWSNASSYLPDFSQHDLAFCLQGEEGFYWPMFLPATTGKKQ